MNNTKYYFDILQSTTTFLSHLITVSREIEQLVPLINQNGEALFMQVSELHFINIDVGHRKN